ncbi:hypothetical protein ABFX02_13G006200 [Erythranthe guttata]
MDSKEEANADGHRHNMPTENSDTIALQKKRARRVSFAEMTSIHFFDRDEESNGTPLAQTAKLGDDSPVQSGLFRQLELDKEFECSDDGNGIDEDEEMEMQRSFLRPIGSPSPGGSTFGSASSNDEDNFFGPVSANFIRPGRLSDSAASDDNHDVTMDSTAFSMHYRSLARSESGLDLKTPTGGPLFFEDKTLTNANTIGSTIVALGKNHIAKSSMPVTEVSGSHNSSEMSIVGENSNKYDYEKLSPGLVALLAESRDDFLNASVITSPSPTRKESEVLLSADQLDNLVDVSDSVRKGTGLINSHNLLNGEESAAHSEFVEANGPHRTLSSGPSPEKKSSNALVAVNSNRDNHKPNRSPSQLSKNESDNSLVASTSSPVKLQQTLLTTASPANYWKMATPLLEHPGSLMRSETVERQETETSIQKSISKLELLEKSAFSSSYRAKVDSSTVKSLDFLRSPNIDSFFGKIHNISRINFVEDPVTEEKLFGVHPSKSYAFSMHDARAEALNHTSGENHLEEHLGQIMGGKLPNEMIPKNISTDQSRHGGPAASPSKITWSGNKLMDGLFPSKHSNEDAPSTETESFLAEIASGEGRKAIVTPKSTSPAGRMVEKKLSASPGLLSFQSKPLLLRSPLKQISDSDKGHDSTPERNLADTNLSNAIDRDAVSKGMTGELSSPFVEANSLKNLTEVNAMDKAEVDICNGKEVVGTIDNFSTPTKENKFQFMHSTNLDEVNITNRNILRIEDNVPSTESRAISHGSVSSPACSNLEEPRLQKCAVEPPTASPLRKKLGYKQSSRISSPKTTQLSGSANKRNVELLLRDTQHRTEMAITQRSPKLQKAGSSDGETISYPNEGRTALAGHEKKWSDSYSKFSVDMKRLISRSADQLNRTMIDVLEDVLVHQQRSKIYEMLHLGVMPQNTTVLHDVQLDKIAETKSMLHQVVFGKAKLQLKHAKRDRLLKRLQLLNSTTKESQILKENIVSQRLKTSTVNDLVDAVGDRSLAVNSKKGHEVCHEKLTAMSQSLEALDGKILQLIGSFHACCKMKAEPSCVDTIALVNKHLIKRASFRFLRQDLQMWVVQSVNSTNGQLNVVLSYLDFIVQSINIIVGTTSSVATSFKLNETNIIKNFPNMDACTAFAFVFNDERACKFVGAKTLAWETQMTGSLLGTLVDVVEEVQSAQIEFQDLTQSSFCSPSAERLDLMLCFLNYNSGRKVFLTLDMSCLKRGIYPSEILPVQPASPAGGRNCSFSKQIFDEIRDAAKRIRPGYTRILRLCRCISQVVQSSTS